MPGPLPSSPARARKVPASSTHCRDTIDLGSKQPSFVDAWHGPAFIIRTMNSCKHNGFRRAVNNVKDVADLIRGFSRPLATPLVAFGMTSLLLIAADPVSAEPVLTIASLQRTTPVDFASEIAPILKRNCVACHQKADDEGGLVLESHASLMKGGDSGPAVVAEDAKSSLLLLRATGEEDPLMPPADNDVGASPLTADELGLLQLWITQGAKNSDASHTESISWQAIPESIRTVYASDVSPDGQQFAFARGNRLFVADIDQPTNSVVLADPALADLATGESGIADVDLIQSIAFSPDGRRLATGGFRTVRLWKRTHPAVESKEAAWMKVAQIISVKPGGSEIALVNAIGDIEVWDVATNDRRASILGHSDRVVGIAWAGSTNQLVVADEAGHISVFDATNGNKLTELELGVSLEQLATGSDGIHIAVRTSDGIAQLLRMVAAAENAPATIQVVHDSLADISDATAVVLITKPALAVSVASETRGVVLVDAAKNQILRTLDAGAIVDAIDVSADQTRLATGSRDGTVQVWNLADGKRLAIANASIEDALAVSKRTRDASRQKALLAKLAEKTKELEELLKKEDEALAAVIKTRDAAAKANEANEAKRVEAAKLVTMTEAAIAKSKAEMAAAEKLAAEAKSRLEQATKQLESDKSAKEKIAAEQADKQADNQADETTAAKTAEAEQKVAATQAEIEKAKADIAAAEKSIAAAKAAQEKSVKELEAQRTALTKAEAEKAKTEAELVKQQRSTDAATAAQKRATEAIPSHQRVVEAETRGLARLDAKLAHAQANLSRPGRAVMDLAWSSDDSQIATVHRDGTSCLIRSLDGQPLTTFPRTDSHDVMGVGTTDRFDVAFVNKTLCRLLIPGIIQGYSLQGQWTLERTIGSIDNPNLLADRVTAIDFRADSMTLAVGSGEPSRSGSVKIFDVRNGTVLRDLGELHLDTVLGLAFSPDSQTLASASADRTIGLTNVASGETTRRLEGHTHHVLSVAWQDSGDVLASAAADQTVKLWNTETGETSRTVSGFPKEVTAVQFVETSDQFVAAGGSGEVRLIKSTNGGKVRGFDAAKEFVFTVAVTPDGKKLIAGDENGIVRIWSVADGKLIAELK
ncbi:WD40 repeat domain-containing protein [Novipirellula caenicola]|uniref:Chromosome partition protein Smc n=1 Tax=Novipirellula caenicola TaxID=1536901 RepID=A0ABP9VWL5_9BACT